MDIAGTLVNGFLIVAVGAFLTYLTVDRSRRLRLELKAEIDGLRRELDGFRRELDLFRQDNKAEHVRFEARMDTDYGRLQTRMDEGYAGLQARMDTGHERLLARMDAGFNAVRSDLTRVALAVGAGSAASAGEADRE